MLRLRPLSGIIGSTSVQAPFPPPSVPPTHKEEHLEISLSSRAAKPVLRRRKRWWGLLLTLKGGKFGEVCGAGTGLGKRSLQLQPSADRLFVAANETGPLPLSSLLSPSAGIIATILVLIVAISFFSSARQSIFAHQPSRWCKTVL